ncbi:MAG TPA: outer membrane beta-barrel protein [Burkholderiales bacterium]|nr:outer membrane beta-barrel protein [Burkholderiales bacterium]
MRKLFLLIAIGASLASGGAQAQSSQGLMFGGKAGFAKPHGSNNDSGFNIAGVLSKQIQPNVYWEAELSLGIIDGEVGRNDNWNINSIAGYGVYRTNGDVHLKAKLGVSYWDDDFDDDFNLTAGIGLGIRAGRGLIDVEYTQINPDTDYITVGYIIPF